MIKIKKVIFSGIALLLLYLIAEVFSFTAYFALKGESPIGKIPSIQEDDLRIDLAGRYFEPQNIHPYLGYVQTFSEKNKDSVSEYGFVDVKSPLQKKSSKKIIVGILGGSLSLQMSKRGVVALAEELKKVPVCSDKDFVFLSLGMAGAKQPQQLMILNYLLVLGGYFDMVINLDGFNEVVLPVTENIPRKIFPFFPRSWNLRVKNDTIKKEALITIGKIANYREQQEILVRIFSAFPMRYSCTAYLVWKCWNKFLFSKISEEKLKLLTNPVGEEGYVITGPSFHYANAHDMYQNLANVWKNCSFQMHKICMANGIKYFHFLQPNQYVPDSKIISEKESKIAFSENQPYKKPVEEGYPYLLDAGKELVSEGVKFHDLTKIFERNNEILYGDNCCHLLQEGLVLLGSTMGKIIAKDIAPLK